MNNLYINLINFNSEKLAGAGYFFRRIISNIDFEDVKWRKAKRIIIFSNGKIDPLLLFNFKFSAKIVVINLPFSANFLVRICYEQVYLPFFLLRVKGVFFSPTPAVPLLCRLFNKKLTLMPTIHDMIPFKIKNKYSFWRNLYVKFLSLKSAQLGDKVLTVSQFSKDDICAIAEISTSKITVIYNFIPELKYQQINHLNSYFVTICTIEPGKNIENMLKGFHTFINSDVIYSNYKYKIIGQFGWKYNAILSMVKYLNLEDHVEFTGYLSDKEKNELLANCTGMIYLSKYEGFGIPPLEAMYFNKVSIVSDRSSLPEVVGKAGIIQDPNDFLLLAENLRKLITESEKYTVNIPMQLMKFEPYLQVSKFEDCIIQSL